MNKLIDADKLKEAVKNKVAYFPFEYKDLLFKLIDELSEEREDKKKTLLNFASWLYGNMDKEIEERIVEDYLRQSIPTLEAISKTSGKDYINGGLVNENNPIKVAIKGDGTEGYGKKIIEYFEDYAITTACTGELRLYYYIKEGVLFNNTKIPEGYTEISYKTNY